MCSSRCEIPACSGGSATDPVPIQNPSATERVRAEDHPAEQVEHPVLRVVFVHRDLLEHDLALGLELAEARRPDHVAHHV
ncbi:MAG TPA: hypothetical protein VFV03_00440, partial [Solirubrobacteraceae bacterium]|nr:hypothetical protein [Solirubrobacteraceae bacterium]